MEIKQADFLVSNSDFTKCPKREIPEYAFIGRSNVGKSSLINMLTGRNKLARVSGTPGKTQLINHYVINDSWFLVDLPGYGWAKVSKKAKGQWEKMIDAYLKNRPNLLCLFVLIDSRIPPQAIDLDFIRQLGLFGVPFAIIFTKSDKQSANKTEKNVGQFKQALLQDWEEIPPHFISSSVKKAGRDEILDFIEGVNQQFFKSL